MESFRRKTAEEILYSISKLHRGHLKIYIGAVSGSGKTYHMLREGQHLKQQGIDVVICAVSTRQRPETMEQLGDLERVRSIHWMKDGTERKDLNLDALIKRNPEVVLVDGLAHRNRKEARFPTRLEDIKYLLNHGISVITTINVYELEGATELAQKWTGVVVEETVPTDTLEFADEIRLIDVSPETILKRLEEGHVNSDSTPLLFKRSNIGKLRELALRLVAEDVNDSLEKYREEQGLIGPSGAAERILVSAQYHWNGSIHIRRGQQIAKRLGGDLLIVSFVPPKKTLSREAATFKRSIIKLVEKIGAKFEELPLPHRWLLPRTLVHYAAQHGVTRIVLGHSKQSRWQELWRGSIANGILKKTKKTDIYFVADRAEKEGERILPTKMQATNRSEDHYRRLSDQEVEKKMGELRRGRFKVLIGAAPGVGKTYTMLREGNDLLKKRIDVVIGLLETHGRKDTMAQVGSLQTIPRAKFEYRGTSLEDLDVQAIVRRNPEVVLVDELAHTNVPGSKNKKRYEDIVEILNAGVSVISTMNVQHLESLNDAVEQITGVRVRETIPDSVLGMADEVELIDVAPKSLQQRMREGKIYALDKVDQALGNFFKTGNLIALRELALREIADDVDERLEAWERNDSLRGPWRRRETVFVGVTTSSNAERLIRRGFRIAYRLKADWVVTYVHDHAVVADELKKRIKVLEDLTARLGGRFIMLFARNRRQIPYMLLNKANDIQSTQIIIGQSKRILWEKIWKPPVIRPILRHGRHMDVLIVADFDPLIQLEET
ncbi:histidine kinase [Paenibacillus sp. FSL H7-0716]|uniref:Histidine kinase n=1 Tax=Paenibacillus odorifer TaxID=189426 RepID=A0A1R0XYG3_9BACL|nr:histidine kinase [Paenibacillus odorifer]OMD40059.1 histidine kinase [Paenibacillus odorifer]OME19825.1 histidine kinase [Paenibacillus odorifer]